MRVLCVGALAWVGCWIACAWAGAWLGGPPAIAVFASAAVVYALGECCYTSVMLPATIALAPEGLRGRYLGAMALAWQAGFLIGPSAGSATLEAAPLALPLICAAGCGAAAAGALLVDRRLGPARRGSLAVTAT